MGKYFVFNDSKTGDEFMAPIEATSIKLGQVLGKRVFTVTFYTLGISQTFEFDVWADYLQFKGDLFAFLKREDSVNFYFNPLMFSDAHRTGCVLYKSPVEENNPPRRSSLDVLLQEMQEFEILCESEYE